MGWKEKGNWENFSLYFRKEKWILIRQGVFILFLIIIKTSPRHVSSGKEAGGDVERERVEIRLVVNYFEAVCIPK